MREPEGEGLAARVPDSPAASRPRPAAACPAAAAEEKAGAGLLRAALAAVRWARSGRPRRGADSEARAERGAGTARGVEERSPEPRAAAPPPVSLLAGACALRAPQPLMSCGARAAAGQGASARPPGTRTRRERSAWPGLRETPGPGRLSLPVYVCLAYSLDPSFKSREMTRNCQGTFVSGLLKPRCRSLPPPPATPMHAPPPRRPKGREDGRDQGCGGSCGG